MNTTLIQDLTIDQTANLAEWQARQGLRAGRRGDVATRDRYFNQFYDVVESARYPMLTTEEVVRRLGRSKSMVLQINRPLINLALGN